MFNQLICIKICWKEHNNLIYYYRPFLVDVARNSLEPLKFKHLLATFHAYAYKIPVKNCQ